MRPILLLSVLLGHAPLFAQGIFQRVLDCSFGNVEAMDVSGTDSYVATSLLDEAFGYHRVVGVVKYGPDQQPLWSNAYMAFSPDVNLWVYDIAATTDGGVVFAGLKNQVLSDTALVVKLDADGQVLWSVAWPSYLPAGASSGSSAQVNAVAQAPNGDLLVTGEYDYFLGELVTRAFVARITAAGTVVWTRSYVAAVDPQTSVRGLDVMGLAGGGIALLGLTGAEGSWLARLNDDGTVQGSTQYGTTSGFDVLFPMQLCASPAGFDILLQTDPYGPDLGCVMHTNSAGALQSSTLYKLPTGLGDVRGMRSLPGGGQLVAGIRNPFGTFNGGNAYLLVLGADHVPTLSVCFGSEDHEYGFAAVPTSDGGYLLGGGAAYEDLGEHRGGIAPRPFLVKTDAQGTYACGGPVQLLVADTVFTSSAHTLVGEPISGWADAPLTSMPWLESVTVCPGTGMEEAEAIAFRVLPNPAADQLTVIPTDQAPWDHVLLDATGRVVRRQPRAIGRLQLDVSDLAPGRYMLRSTSGDAVRSTAVMVVR